MTIRTLGLALAFTIVGTFTPHAAQADTSVEAAVRAYFHDAPVMIEIANCESKFKQFNTDGTVLYGGWGGGMIGVFQLYESVHHSAATSLGFDIATLAGNLGYAKHLYTSSGTTPWNSSKACWSVASSAGQTPEADLEELQAQVDALMKIVTQLQQLLAQKQMAMLN